MESVLSCGVSKRSDPHSGLLLEQQTWEQMLLSRDIFTSRPGAPLYGSGLCHINNCRWIMAIFLQISQKLMTARVSYAARATSIPIPWKNTILFLGSHVVTSFNVSKEKLKEKASVWHPRIITTMMGFPLMRSPSVSQKWEHHSQNSHGEIREIKRQHRDETEMSSHMNQALYPALPFICLPFYWARENWTGKTGKLLFKRHQILQAEHCDTRILLVLKTRPD